MASSPTSATSTIAQLAVGAHHHALVPVGAEADRLAVLERDEHLLATLLAGHVLEGAVVEDVAVLEDLHERRALVGVGGAEDLDHVLAVEVVGAGHEGRFGAERHRQRVERRVEEPNGVDFVTLPSSEVGEYWPLVARRSGC